MPKNEFVKKNLYNDPSPTLPEQPTFKTVCNKWLGRELKKKDCIPNTLKIYHSKLKPYLFKAPFADNPIDTIKINDIEQWIFKLRKTCTEKCINGILDVTNNIFNYAFKRRFTEIKKEVKIKHKYDNQALVKEVERVFDIITTELRYIETLSTRQVARRLRKIGDEFIGLSKAVRRKNFLR
jgi:hypothetical protein